MGRSVDPNLQALIDSGHCTWFSTIILTLTDGTTLYLSTGELVLSGRPFTSQLKDIAPLSLSLLHQQDFATFKIQNVDFVIGQTITGSERLLDGASAMLGIAFYDEVNNVIYYQDKMPGDIVAGEVEAEEVQFELVAPTDNTKIAGRTVASEYPWQEPITTTPIGGGDDLTTNIRDRLFNIREREREERGRYLDLYLTS